MKRSAISLLLLILAGLGGCAYPDVRSAVYAHLGPSTIVMRPPVNTPRDHFANNDSTFVPGTLLRLRRKHILPRNDSRQTAEEWGITSARWCPVSSNLYHLDETGPSGPYIDINLDYSLDASLWTPFDWLTKGSPPANTALRDQAQRDLELSPNDLRFVRRIQIHISNIKHYQATPDQLLSAKDAILGRTACRRLLTGPNVFQIERIYSAQLYDIDVETFDGASVNVGLLKSKIFRHFQWKSKGSNVFFALTAAPVLGSNGR